MSSHLKRINAWSKIEDSDDSPDPHSKNWTALQASQSSCGAEALARISEVQSAKRAWNLLATFFGQILEVRLNNK